MSAALSAALASGSAQAQFKGSIFLPQAYTDGAGSLVDPTNSGSCPSFGNYGCSRDTVRLHPHSVPSAGFFQVLNSGGLCDFVRLSGTMTSVSSLLISVKKWNEDYPGQFSLVEPTTTIYRATSLPVNFKVPVGWSVANVTTTDPIPSGAGAMDLTMQCKSGSFFQEMPGTQISDIAPSIAVRDANPFPHYNQDFFDGYWGGNGSLVSFSNHTTNVDSAVGYGRTRDVANAIVGSKSMVAFQVYAGNTTCRNVRISANVVTSAFIDRKLWDAPIRTPVSQAGTSAASAALLTLPVTVQLPANQYSVIFIDTPLSTAVSLFSANCV